MGSGSVGPRRGAAGTGGLAGRLRGKETAFFFGRPRAVGVCGLAVGRKPDGRPTRLSAQVRGWTSYGERLTKPNAHCPRGAVFGEQVGDTDMPASTFQKGDRVVLKESYENVEGQIILVLKDHMYKVAWDSGLTYKGKTT